VDDGGEMPLEAAVAPFLGRLDLALVTRRHVGSAAACNTSAARARGEIFAFTDDDCAPAADWLLTLAARVATTSDHAIGGRTVNALPENPYSSASQQLIAHLTAYYNADPSRARFFASNNLAMPAESFRAIGGFDATFPTAAAEDRELGDRWRHKGFRITYAPEVVVYHAHPLIFRTFWRQHFNYGHGAFRFHHIHGRQSRDRIKVEPLSFYLGLLRQPLVDEWGRRALLLAALLVISQGANTAGFFWEGLNHFVKKKKKMIQG